MPLARFPAACAGKTAAPNGWTSRNAARFSLARKEIRRSESPANSQSAWPTSLNSARTFSSAEITLGPLYCMYYGAKNNRRYEPLPRFPGVERDFSLFLAGGVTFAEVT